LTTTFSIVPIFATQKPGKQTSSNISPAHRGKKPSNAYRREHVRQSSTGRKSPHSPSPLPSLHQLSKISIQPKLKINAPGDKYEQEADYIAAQVMQRLAHKTASPAGNKPKNGLRTTPSGSSVQRKCSSCEKEEAKDEIQAKPLAAQITPLIQRQTDDAVPREEEELSSLDAIQTKGNSSLASTASPTLASNLQSTKGSGRPLPAPTRSRMEKAFGTDFRNVRIHTDSTATTMNKAIHAQAFTHGRDIYFGAGKFQPETAAGQRLLAHELVHVGQQRKNSRHRKIQRQIHLSQLVKSKRFLNDQDLKKTWQYILYKRRSNPKIALYAAKLYYLYLSSVYTHKDRKPLPGLRRKKTKKAKELYRFFYFFYKAKRTLGAQMKSQNKYIRRIRKNLKALKQNVNWLGVTNWNREGLFQGPDKGRAPVNWRQIFAIYWKKTQPLLENISPSKRQYYESQFKYVHTKLSQVVHSQMRRKVDAIHKEAPIEQIRQQRLKPQRKFISRPKGLSYKYHLNRTTYYKGKCPLHAKIEKNQLTVNYEKFVRLEYQFKTSDSPVEIYETESLTIPLINKQYGLHWTLDRKLVRERVRYYIDKNREACKKIFHEKKFLGLRPGKLITRCKFYSSNEEELIRDILHTIINSIDIVLSWLANCGNLNEAIFRAKTKTKEIVKILEAFGEYLPAALGAVATALANAGRSKPLTAKPSRTKPPTSTTSRTKPPTSTTSRTKPPTSTTSRTKPPTSTISRTKPPTATTSRTKPPTATTSRTKQLTGKTIDQKPKQLTGKTIDQKPKQLTGKTIGQKPKQLTGKTIDQKPKQLTGKTIDQKPKQLTGKTIDQKPKQLTGKTIDQKPKQLTGKTIDQKPKQLTGKTIDQKPKQLTGKTIDQKPKQLTGKTIDQKPKQLTGKTIDQKPKQLTGKTIDQKPKQLTGKTIDQKPKQLTGKTIGQKPKQLTGKTIDQKPKQLTGKTLERPKLKPRKPGTIGNRNPKRRNSPGMDYSELPKRRPSPKRVIGSRKGHTKFQFHSFVFDKASCPLKIPKMARVKIRGRIKSGYVHVSFRWKRGRYRYDARWHNKTPRAPKGTGKTWVVERETIGGGGKHILTGKYRWTPMHKWWSARRAYNSNTMTPAQKKLLKDGHWPAY
jgi:hypothetical protein